MEFEGGGGREKKERKSEFFFSRQEEEHEIRGGQGKMPFLLSRATAATASSSFFSVREAAYRDSAARSARMERIAGRCLVATPWRKG